ncbi:MAG TPA: SAM-dependent methyltransferase, partial [Candidatus Nanoarchaeia archaeon]|nr:SAM-dependent methyltransferase [Candidatus Nanoarchaeia archaeon]
LIIGIFSSTGPKKCSGLDVIRYSKNSMKKVFANNFQLINSLETIHTTPFNTEQNFIFCHFRRI